MVYNSTGFGVDSSSYFPFRAHTHRQTRPIALLTLTAIALYAAWQRNGQSVRLATQKLAHSISVVPLSGNNLGQVVYIRVLLSPSSTRGVDVLRLGR